MPNRDTPPKLVEAWLDFHREELCRKLDAVFAFDRQGMEIWCRGEENRDYRKLHKILEPLQNSYNVELYLTRLTKNNDDEDAGLSWTNIPPSLTENRELRFYLRSPMPNNPSQILTYTDSEGQVHTFVVPGESGSSPANEAAANRVLHSRLIAWAKLVMENSRITRQYASDIPELLRTAFEPAFGVALCGRARDVCRKHAKDLVKSISSLRKNLSRAFPLQPPAKAAENKKSKKEHPADLTDIIERADGIAAEARILSRRVYRFIYPAEYTVDLDELKRPGLLVSLDAFDAEVRDFEQDLEKR